MTIPATICSGSGMAKARSGNKPKQFARHEQQGHRHNTNGGKSRIFTFIQDVAAATQITLSGSSDSYLSGQHSPTAELPGDSDRGGNEPSASRSEALRYSSRGKVWQLPWSCMCRRVRTNAPIMPASRPFLTAMSIEQSRRFSSDGSIRLVAALRTRRAATQHKDWQQGRGGKTSACLPVRPCM